MKVIPSDLLSAMLNDEKIRARLEDWLTTGEPLMIEINGLHYFIQQIDDPEISGVLAH